MKIAIFGLGYVGSTAAGCIASQGHSVVGIDVSEAKVAALNAGRFMSVAVTLKPAKVARLMAAFDRLTSTLEAAT